MLRQRAAGPGIDAVFTRSDRVVANADADERAAIRAEDDVRFPHGLAGLPHGLVEDFLPLGLGLPLVASLQRPQASQIKLHVARFDFPLRLFGAGKSLQQVDSLECRKVGFIAERGHAIVEVVECGWRRREWSGGTMAPRRLVRRHGRGGVSQGVEGHRLEDQMPRDAGNDDDQGGEDGQAGPHTHTTRRTAAV